MKQKNSQDPSITHNLEPITPPLVVIVGPTASGKSAAAIDLAKKAGGEIICADSRTIYKGMDIGTAKPTKAEQSRTIHHLIDLIEPDESFTAAEFKRMADEAIKDIQNRGKLPIMVGGTGLYIDSVIFDYQFSKPGAERDMQNPRHLKKTETLAVNTLRTNTLILGIDIEQSELISRIHARIRHMTKTGLMEEVRGLVDRYGWDAPGLNTIGYQESKDYFNGSKTLEATYAEIEKNTLLYAKRQRTWFKRNKGIHWENYPSKIVDIATTKLNKLD